MGIVFANLPLAFVGAAFLAALGEEQLLVREDVVDQLDVVELVGDIPVKGSAPDEFSRFRVAQHRAGPLDHQVVVVIPDQQPYVAQAARYSGFSLPPWHMSPLVFIISIIARREVATVDMCPAKGRAKAMVWVKVSPQEFGLSFFGQLAERHAGMTGEQLPLINI